MKSAGHEGVRPIALITGVGRQEGIGAAIAERLAADGWDLALSWWAPYDQRVHGTSDEAGINEVVNACVSAGARVALYPVDLADPVQASGLIDAIAAEFGPVSALVMSHCESVDSDFTTTSIEAFDRHFAVNARAPFLLIQAYAKALRSTAPATDASANLRRIIALTSDHTAFNLPYGASKGSLDRIVIAAARELADLNVAANVINPGPNDTGWMDEPTQSHIRSATPGGRLGLPTDTAALIGFLCSPQGGWINGQLLHSDGGFSA